MLPSVLLQNASSNKAKVNNNECYNLSKYCCLQCIINVSNLQSDSNPTFINHFQRVCKMLVSNGAEFAYHY